MARIAVAQTALMAKGGGAGVCMTVLEALQSDHDVELLTVARPDFSALKQ